MQLVTGWISILLHSKAGMWNVLQWSFGTESMDAFLGLFTMFSGCQVPNYSWWILVLLAGLSATEPEVCNGTPDSRTLLDAQREKERIKPRLTFDSTFLRRTWSYSKRYCSYCHLFHGHDATVETDPWATLSRGGRASTGKRKRPAPTALNSYCDFAWI